MAGNLDDEHEHTLLRNRATIDAALAEFTALRSELITHTNTQNALVGFGLSAVGVVVGLSFSAPGRQQLLTIVPIVASVVILAYCGEAFRVISIGCYIRYRLWPFLGHRAGDDLPSWEEHVAVVERGWGGVVEVPIIGMFATAGVIGAVLADGVPIAINVIELIVVAGAAGLGILLIHRGRRRVSPAG